MASPLLFDETIPGPTVVAGIGSSTLVAGITPTSISSAGTVTDAGYNYTLIVQVPVPVLSLNVNLLGDFILPILTLTQIPKGVLWLVNNASAIFQNTVDAAVMLIKAIPELTITILVKVGPIVVLNVQLVAKKVPFDIPVPTFDLGLPNFAVGLNIDLSSLIPIPPPIIIQVPIPVPNLVLPDELLRVTGGRVSAEVNVDASDTQPSAIINPVKLPVI